MSLKEAMKADLSVFYNSDEFAKECIYKDKKVSILFAKNDLDFSGVDTKRISGRADDFIGIEDGDILEIEGRKYTVINFSFESKPQLFISIKDM